MSVERDDGTVPVEAGLHEGDSINSNQWKSYLVCYNVAKKHNVGTIARCATAFNVEQICLVGMRHYNSFGSHGADAYVSLSHYDTIEECCNDLKTNKGCTVIGVEIIDSAIAVDRFPFNGNVAFMLGDEGQGLNEKQLRLCDKFIYIPQYGPGTASLNVAVATSIVLHHFALKAGYQERPRQGYKFILDSRPQRTTKRGYMAPSPEQIAAAKNAEQVGDESASLVVDFSSIGLPAVDSDAPS